MVTLISKHNINKEKEKHYLLKSNNWKNHLSIIDDNSNDYSIDDNIMKKLS